MFPPLNKLTIFSEDEINETLSKCKSLMSMLNFELLVDEISTVSNELFADFLHSELNLNIEEKIAAELIKYRAMNVSLVDSFNILQWWHSNKHSFPIMYKLSVKIFCIPASSAESERAFSKTNNLISDKRCALTSLNNDNINKIMFLHTNL